MMQRATDHNMKRSREPAVAGLFYPDDPGVLRSMIRGYLERVEVHQRAPKALIAPHAGYIYSGPVAASAYALISALRGQITRVVLLGPSHRVYFEGLALSSAELFATPFGHVEVDVEAITAIESLTGVRVLDDAHAEEHSLEVHLPFLQQVLGEFKLVPIVVGEASPGEIAQVLARLWGGPETLIVVSSDLSHFLDYASAVRVDGETTRAIEELREDIRPAQACGCRPLNGLLHLARQSNLEVTTLDVRNSGDTAGNRDRVVGYGAYALK